MGGGGSQHFLLSLLLTLIPLMIIQSRLSFQRARNGLSSAVTRLSWETVSAHQTRRRHTQRSRGSFQLAVVPGGSPSSGAVVPRPGWCQDYMGTCWKTRCLRFMHPETDAGGWLGGLGHCGVTNILGAWVISRALGERSKHNLFSLFSWGERTLTNRPKFKAL